MDEKFDIEIEEAVENNDEFLYEGDPNEKDTASYEAAVKAVVFGSLSIMLPLFSILFFVFGLNTLAIVVAIVGVMFAIVGRTSAKKCKDALAGSLTEGLAKAGKTVSLIGLIAAVAALAYIVASILLTIILVVLIVVFYVFIYIIAIIAALSAGQM